MKTCATRRRGLHLTSVALLALTAAAFCVAPLGTSRADEASATKILKSMTDYVGKQATVSLTFDADIEVVTPTVQKVQFSSSGSVVLNRPDKARLTRTGGYADVELVFDGKTATLHDRGGKRFAQVNAAGTFDQLVDRLRAEHLVEMPGADLLLANVFDELTHGILEARHIGRGVVGGVECEHLAFRNQDTDWQIWIELGERPVPRKYVITSKGVAAAPQYTLHVRDWKSDAKPAADAFVFNAAAGVVQVPLGALTDLDEVPSGVVAGGTK
jgi:hypothetical protein